MEKESRAIGCPKFLRQEDAIKGITDTLNAAKGAAAKAEFAGELKKAVDLLLSCEDHDDKESDCRNCHFIGQIRRKTADLIMRARNLA
ncbi:MAG: hypothetical protein WCP22_04485 [Chlamydiota bacterium]